MSVELFVIADMACGAQGLHEGYTIMSVAATAYRGA